LGYVARFVEQFFGYLKEGRRALYNNINPRKTLFMPLVDFLLGGVRCVVHRVEVTGLDLIQTGPTLKASINFIKGSFMSSLIEL